MLSITIDVNGEVIGKIDVVNKGPADAETAEDPMGRRVYEWRSHDARGGQVVHTRADGWAILVEVVMDDYLFTTDFDPVVPD